MFVCVYVCIKTQQVNIRYDSDATTKPHIQCVYDAFMSVMCIPAKAVCV